MATEVRGEGMQSSVRAALGRLLRGEAQSSARVTLRIVKCSTQLSDYDGLVVSYKALVDQLRDAGAFQGDDSPKNLKKPDYDQIKVATKKEVGTWLEITIPD